MKLIDPVNCLKSLSGTIGVGPDQGEGIIIQDHNFTIFNLNHSSLLFLVTSLRGITLI